VKQSQRIDYIRLTEGLVAQGLADPAAVQDVVRQAQETGALLSELLVGEAIVSDYDLARVACEVFGLPFVPVDVYAPAEAAREGIDPDFLRRFSLVPLDRYGKLLTVAMPCVVPADVLANLSQRCDAVVLPVVSTLSANRRWLDENIPKVEVEVPVSALPKAPAEAKGAWTEMFDAADAAVRLDLDAPELEGLGPDLEDDSPRGPKASVDLDLDLEPLEPDA